MLQPTADPVSKSRLLSAGEAPPYDRSAMATDSIMYWIFLFALGLVVGCFGTLIGAGGGFVLMPLLVLLYPDVDAELLVSISLAVVFVNAASGSIGYARHRKIDYRAGLVFSAASVPGAVLGALTTGFLPRRAFDMILGVLLTAASVFLAFSVARRVARRQERTDPEGNGGANGAVGINLDSDWRDAPRIRYAVERGVAISFAVGFMSSMLGIGGGIIHVSALILLLDFPVHVAAATSHFVLALTALAGTAVHIAGGSFQHGWRVTGLLGAGVVIGAQMGVKLARRTRPTYIIRGLALALALVGVRIIYAALRYG